MPTYYFHIRSHDGFIRDLEGTDLPDMRAVTNEAREGARQIMAAAVWKGQAPDHQSFQVEDEDGQTVLDYPFQKALGV